MHGINPATHAETRRVRKDLLSSKAIAHRQEWHKGRQAGERLGASRAAGWAGHWLVPAGE